MIKLRRLLREAKVKKGDTIIDMGEEGKVHSVSKGMAYVKFPSTPESSFGTVPLMYLEPVPDRPGVWKAT